jgi:hypothetical protein
MSYPQGYLQPVDKLWGFRYKSVIKLGVSVADELAEQWLNSPCNQPITL